MPTNNAVARLNAVRDERTVRDVGAERDHTDRRRAGRFRQRARIVIGEDHDRVGRARRGLFGAPPRPHVEQVSEPQHASVPADCGPRRWHGGVVHREDHLGTVLLQDLHVRGHHRQFDVHDVGLPELDSLQQVGGELRRPPLLRPHRPAAQETEQQRALAERSVPRLRPVHLAHDLELRRQLLVQCGLLGASQVDERHVVMLDERAERAAERCARSVGRDDGGHERRDHQHASPRRTVIRRRAVHQIRSRCVTDHAGGRPEICRRSSPEQDPSVMMYLLRRFTLRPFLFSLRRLSAARHGRVHG